VHHGTTNPTGRLGLEVVPAATPVPDELGHISWSSWPAAITWTAIWLHAFPHRGLGREVNLWRLRNLRSFWRGLRRWAAGRMLDVPMIYGALYLDVIRADGTHVPLGLASLRVVTTVGSGFIVDAFQNLTELENMKYHGIGTSATAEAVGDTALVAELTTQYQTANTRAAGTTTESAQTVYRTVGTNTVAATAAIQEHGVFSAASAGVLLDRTAGFTVVNLAANDSLQATYDLSLPAGS
jgi:hypothetical protein